MKFDISTETNGDHCSKCNATARYHSKGFYNAYHWLICLTYIYYAWYYPTFIGSPAFSIDVTALKLCRAISDAKDDLWWAYHSLWKWNQIIILKHCIQQNQTDTSQVYFMGHVHSAPVAPTHKSKSIKYFDTWTFGWLWVATGLLVSRFCMHLSSKFELKIPPSYPQKTF